MGVPEVFSAAWEQHTGWFGIDFDQDYPVGTAD